MTEKPDGKTKLSPRQINRWRRILSLSLGPYALIMPDEEIQRHKESAQRRIDATEAPEKQKES